MKNSKNKIIAAVICGMVIGSVGTSIVGKFQTSTVSTVSASNSGSLNSSNATSDAASSESNNSNSDSSGNSQSSTSSSAETTSDGRGGKGKGGHHQGAASLDSTEGVDVASGSYKDGTYEGTASGYAQNLTVSVAISGGKIESVDVTSHNETPGFYEKAFETVPSEIVASQSTNVDTASGATYSSVGIINAVNNALSSAAN